MVRRANRAAHFVVDDRHIVDAGVKGEMRRHGIFRDQRHAQTTEARLARAFAGRRRKIVM